MTTNSEWLYTIHGYNNVFADIKKLEGGEPDLNNSMGMKFFSPIKVSQDEHKQRVLSRYDYNKNFEKLILSTYPEYKGSIDDFPVLVYKTSDFNGMVSLPFSELREVYLKLYNSENLFTQEQIKDSIRDAVGFDVWTAFLWIQNLVSRKK